MTAFPPALRRRVLRAIEPPATLTRRAHAAARELARKLNREASALGIAARAKLVGSLAKDTHLADPLDVDLFILFPKSTPRTTLERVGVQLGKKVLRKPVLRYAEHPYVHGEHAGFTVDIVPAYKLSSAQGRLTAVDRTPFHTAYVKRHATARHRREIRLLKRFLRATRCYGAETAVGGVSGYLAELLILKFGTFPGALKAIRDWEPPIELSLGEKSPGLGGVLAFVDPVDLTRNAAAAVTPPTLARLQRAAREFLRRPREAFFFAPTAQTATAREVEALVAPAPLLGLEVPWPKGKPETHLPQALRLLSKIQRVLAERGFRVERSEAAPVGEDGVLLLWLHDPRELPATHTHRGPRADDAENVARFLDKWKGNADAVAPPMVKAGRWTVEVRRRVRSPAALLEPKLAELLEGFEWPSAALRGVRFEAGLELARDARRHEALRRFALALDPWDP